MKKYIYKTLFVVSIIGTLISCEVREFSDLNNAETDAFRQDLTRGDLQDLVGGILYSTRVRLGTYFDAVGVIGREFWRFSSSDPRFTADLLGKDKAVLDNNTFYLTNPWAARYRSVKNANLILEFLDSQDLSAQFTDQEINATKGFLKTFIGYELLLNLNMTYQNGIRVDVADENNLGPFVSYDASLSAIRDYLEDGATDLENGGPDFPFILSSGFDGFNSPATFLQVNKAISARVAAYQGDNQATLDFLEDSFLNLSSDDLYTGIYYNFSLDQTDLSNPMYFAVEGLSTAGARIAHPSLVSDAENNDNRLDKIAQLDEPLVLDGLSGNYAVYRYKTNIDDIPIIRNEELILLYAEANITINPDEAVRALNIIRASAGLGPYSGPTDTESLIDEMLFQRRYSLFAEGHRWVDMRRYNRLGELPIDRPATDVTEADNVFTQFPIPLTENQ